jgi:DNA-directed RNA polymerase
MAYAGGYLLFNEPLVRGHGPNSHTAHDMGKMSGYTVGAVNHIQETPWAVNHFVLDTVLTLQGDGLDVGYTSKGKFNSVLILKEPLNPRLDPLSPVSLRYRDDVFAAFSKEQKQAVTKAKSLALDTYEEQTGVYRATCRIIKSAEDMAQFERFYFPHNLDFRTRIYPIPTDLTPQSNDLSKGLLRFARGSRLGAIGLYWMAFSVSTNWGEDKLSPDARVKFAYDPGFIERMEEWVDDPLTNRGWIEADSPIQFLAVAHEFVWAMRSADPASFVSFLPGNLDGSCNGAQHLSIMSRDPVGAKATNCTATLDRNDLYMEVADKVWTLVQADAALGNPLAIHWVSKLMEPSDRRKVVKRSVMTVPYGVTSYGVADFMIKDKHVGSEVSNQWDHAKYLRNYILAAIDDTLKVGRKLQVWFQLCATVCAEAGKPLIWDTPAGSKVTQAYRNVVQKRIRTANTRFVVYEEEAEDEEREEFYDRIGMNIKKMGTSAPPNVVHSCDASHLQITVCRMADVGIRDFSMIHDSFGCPFSQMTIMRDILRRSIVDMYSGNYLEEWKLSVEGYTGLTMPEPPELGDFDINEILESEFFFS